MQDQSSQLSQASAGAQMHQLIFGFMALPAIAAAAKLGIADLVGQSPKTVDELADATKAHPLSLRRLLQFLAGLGIFAEDAAGKFGQTPMSESMRSTYHVREQSKRSRAPRRPLLSVARFRTHSLETTLGFALLVFGLVGVLILLWLEFTNPKLLESAVSRSLPEAAKHADEAMLRLRNHNLHGSPLADAGLRHGSRRDTLVWIPVQSAAPHSLEQLNGLTPAYSSVLLCDGISRLKPRAPIPLRTPRRWHIPMFRNPMPPVR